jgi:chromosome segregation protein
MLRAVYIKGFKTFARPVRMPLEGGITSIVGPNGSGKSNITDAVAWALGEQRPVALRAETMNDVIFSGSETLPAARVAEVTLVLDNGRGEISLPYEEVALTRRLSRSGDSEYRINGARSRLQDVRAIAGEAGIGQHSILRQGAVDAIVSGGAEACRNALEEAAGLGVFRRRRRIAGRRLERAAERLERSRELEREMEERLRQIEREAVAAREYRDLETRLRRLSLAHLYRTAARGVEERERQVREQDRRVARLFERSEELRSQRAELDRELQGLAERSRELDSTVQRLERASQAVNRELVRGERNAARYAAADSRRESRQRSLARLTTEREEATRRLEELEAGIRELEDTYARERERLAGAEERLRASRNESAAAGARRERLEEDLERLRARREKLAELAGVEPVLPEVDLGRVAGLREALNAAGSEEVAGPEGLRSRISGSRRKAQLLGAELSRRWGALSALVGRAEASLRTLEGAARRSGGGVRLQDAIRALPGYEAAVEAALGELAGGVIVESLESGRRALAGGERVAVRLDAEGVAGYGPGPGRPLIECVQVVNPEHGDAIERLLGGIFVVEEPDSASRLNGWTAVTREGLRLTRASVSRRLEEGEFSRRSRVDAERTRLEALQGKLRERLREMQDAVREAERGLDGISSAADALSRASQRSWRAVSRLQTKLEARLRAIEREHERSTRAHEDLRALEEELEPAALALEEARTAGTELEEGLRAAERAAVAARERVQGAGGRLSEARYRRDQLRSRQRHLEERLRKLRGADAGPERLWAVSRRALDAGERSARALAARLEELRSRRAGYSAEQDRVSTQRDRTSRESLELAEDLAQARASAERAREELTRLREDSDQARAEISDEWGATLEEARSESESLPDDIDRERRQLVRRLNRFGDVNLLAIAQEDEVRERYEFVSGQRRDAEEAAEELERIIQEVDRELEERFVRTFRRIRSAFGEIIPRMMAEASGELELTEEGIEIGIRLRRKGRRSLHVLSGGERSLLALSYLFSIFLAREGAFCILDEAEAALDDVNLARFLSVVDSYRSDGQFVLVTHQKRTMAAADVLYGVTVDASGVSTVVSKRLSGEVAEG